MELGSIFLVLAVIVIVGIYLYAPFMTYARRARAARKTESNEVSALKAERDRVINSLQELDFDFNLGKIPAGEYPDQRESLLQKGADILRKLDELVPVASSSINAESRIEKATAAGRADAGSTFPAITDSDDDELESMIAARRKQHNSKSAGFCPKCGKAVLVSDKFCPACGKSL